ncbi:MAG TPA: outer membrane protein assembly factor BamA [Kofleriaceae bacterium]|nr:outer membrane protein assembly factor BamA [Kofleriaceae bacterium]
MKCLGFAFAGCLLAMGLAHAEPAIEQIGVRGNHRMEAEVIRLAVASKVGAPLVPEKLAADVRSIWKLGAFSDVQVVSETGQSGAIVTFEVVERPTIRKVLVAGNDDVELDKINEVLDLHTDEVADFTAIHRNRDHIAELYEARGYMFATVDAQMVPAGTGEIDVHYTIDEHAKVKVADVTFVGNRSISSKDLREHMATRTPGALSFLNGSGVFRRNDLDRDLAVLTGYYLDRGFATVKISPPQLRLSRDHKRMTVTIEINEGPRFTYGAVEVKGDLLGSTADNLALLHTRPGTTFARAALEADRKALEIHYQDLGYARASVALRPQFDLPNRRIALSFEVTRGKRVYVERIHIRGNSKTRDKVIRREMRIAEGELYSGTRIERSRAQIVALGYFEDVTVSTQNGSSEDFIDVNVEVRERPTGTFQLGAGFSSQEKFIVQGQVAMQNLGGRGESLQAQVAFSGLRRLFMLRFTEPYFLDTRWIATAEAYNQSRGFGWYSRTATGGALTWGYPISDRINAFLTYRLENVSISGASGGIASLGATAAPLALDTANLFRGGWTSSVRGTMSYDTRDNRLFPTQGYYATAFAEYAGRVTGSENQYVRWGGFARRYQHLGPFVLRLNAELGVTTSLDGRGVPLTERYLLGGITDIRGYAPRSLGPRLWSQRPGDVGQDLAPLAIGGNVQVIGNAELEFPIVKKLGLSGVAFFDLGNAYNLESRFCNRPGTDACPSAIEMVSGLRKSVGVGVRWLSPLGPLRFEWGLPLDLRPGEKPAGLEFTIGGSF